MFRIYLSDVGLLRHKTNTKITNIQDISYKDDITGIIAENYVACELKEAYISKFQKNMKRW